MMGKIGPLVTVDLDSGVMMFMIDLLLSLQGPF